MSRRKKFQSIDWFVGAIKSIATNEKYSAKDRLAALDRLAVIDQIYVVALKSLADQNNNSNAEPVFTPPVPDVDVDAILEKIK